MPSEPYSVTRDGRLIVRDVDALRARMKAAMERLDTITDQDEREWGDDTPQSPEGPLHEAAGPRATRERPGRAG